MATKVDELIRAGLADSEELLPLAPEDLPLLPLFWSVIVEPLVPKKITSSGIIISDESRKVEKIQNTVGRVLAVGDLAFQAKTSGGLDLSRDTLAAQLSTGAAVRGGFRYVLFARYTGQEVKFMKDGHERTIIILSDSELLAVVNDPSVIRFWI